MAVVVIPVVEEAASLLVALVAVEASVAVEVVAVEPAVAVPWVEEAAVVWAAVSVMRAILEDARTTLAEKIPVQVVVGYFPESLLSASVDHALHLQGVTSSVLLSLRLMEGPPLVAPRISSVMNAQNA